MVLAPLLLNPDEKASVLRACEGGSYISETVHTCGKVPRAAIELQRTGKGAKLVSRRIDLLDLLTTEAYNFTLLTRPLLMPVNSPP